MAMQYLSGSKGISTPSGVEVEVVYDTCSESQFVWVRAVVADNTVLNYVMSYQLNIA